MTDAERLAKEYTEAEGGRWGGATQWPCRIAAMQRLIDSGVVTVNPPPDPADQIADAYGPIFDADCEAPFGVKDIRSRTIQHLIDDGWIIPGPRCEGVDPDPRDAVVEAAAAWVAADGNATTSEASRQYAVLCDAVHDWTGGGRRG